jgi:hypothetical protein
VRHAEIAEQPSVEAAMSRALLAFALAALLHPAVAQAGKPDKGGNGPASRDGGGDVSVDVNVDVVFGPRERTIVREYYVARNGKGHCPPGLAKKNNGCLPPGHEKKRYEVGREIERDVVLLPVPHDLEVRIGLPPRGYRYAVIDGDVVKLALGTLMVVDAIDALTD